jgi:hypothetical protein
MTIKTIKLPDPPVSDDPSALRYWGSSLVLSIQEVIDQVSRDTYFQLNDERGLIVPVLASDPDETPEDGFLFLYGKNDGTADKLYIKQSDGTTEKVTSS